MKGIICSEVEAFLLRPNITSKSIYYAVLHLAEMRISRRPEDAKLAAQMIRLFVGRLEEALKPPKPDKKVMADKRKRHKYIQKRKKGLQDDDNRLIRTLINGVQRAIPYMEAGLVTGSPLETE